MTDMLATLTPNLVSSWQELWSQVRNQDCQNCDLYQYSPHNKVCLMGQGPVPCDWMWIGEAPGSREQQVEKPFSGPVGQYFDLILENVGIDRNQAYITNICKCKPLHDDKPTPTQASACKHYLLEEIRLVHPKKILLIGDAALNALTGKSKISSYRGKVLSVNIEGLDYPVEVYPIFHPGYIKRNPKLYPIEFTDLLKFRGAKTNGEDIPKNYVPVTDMPTFRKVIRELLSAPEISFDYETESLDPHAGARIICIGLSPKEGTAYCIPLETELAPWTPLELKDIYRLLGAVLSNRKCIHSAFNSSFELKWSKHRHIPAKCDSDPMVTVGLLDENLPHDLGTSVQMYVDPSFVKLDSQKISTWDWDKIYPYNCGDADYNLRLAHIAQPKLKQEPSSQRLYDNLLMPFQTKVLPRLELNGIYVHEDKLQQAEERCIPERDKQSQEVLKYVPEGYVLPVKSRKALKRGFNPGSPKQLSDLLFNTLGLPDLQQGSTAESVLIELKGRHPIMVPIMEFRKYEKLLDFLESWKELKDSRGFIHPHYHLIPVTGRLSCTDPNLQQVPRILFIRNVIGAPPGYVLLIFDYSQIELRIVAYYSQDPEMMKAFLNHEDIHLLTACDLTNIPMDVLRSRIKAGEEEAKELRKKAKAVNFGLVFEMGAYGLVKYAKEKYEVDLTFDEATLWRSKFFKKYSHIPLWHQDQIQRVHRDHKVVSMIGRVRHLNNILSSDDDVVAEAERQSINSPVQGLASDFNLMSAVEVEKILPPRDGWLAGLVHDESIYCIREDRADYWKPIIKDIMEHPKLEKFISKKFNVPIEVETEVSRYWS